MTKTRFWALCAALAVTTIPALASADVDKTTDGQDSYGYIFKDELVNSDVQGPKGGSITVRPKAWRTNLLRPRAQFIAEMYKSVENI